MSDPQFDMESNVATTPPSAGGDSAPMARAGAAFTVAGMLFLSLLVYNLGELVMALGPGGSFWTMFGTVVPILAAAGMLGLTLYGQAQIRAFREAQQQAQARIDELTQARDEHSDAVIAQAPEVEAVRTAHAA